MNSTAERRAEMEAILLAPLVKPSRFYDLGILIMAMFIMWGLYAWSEQLRHGLIVTGMRDQVFWGLYISNVVFFVSLSLTGTFLSAVLRITGNHWQAPVTRLAEVVTGAALLMAATMILVDMGRPERVFYVFIHGRLQSPLIWDVMAVTSYLVGSIIYLYLPMIPDIAICRDRLSPSVSPLRRKVYDILALGWQDSAKQQERLNKLISIMTVLIIPVAVSVHSVTAWIFAMTFRPGWDVTILAPYFVASAFFSGVAAIIIAMTVYRKVFKLEKYITWEHYRKLGWLLLALLLVYAYFSFAELLPGAYKLATHERELLNLLLTGQQAFLFWVSLLGSIVVPAVLICWRRTRTVAGLTVASVLITVTLWIKKSYLLIVPTLQVSLMPFDAPGRYHPTWVEWSLSLAAIAGFMLMVALFFRFFPVIAIWETSRAAGEGG